MPHIGPPRGLAQLVACHNASMECYRRAMMPEQSFDGRQDNLNQQTSSRGPTRRCWKPSTGIGARGSRRSRSSTSTSTKADKPSSGMSRPRGVGSHRNQALERGDSLLHRWEAGTKFIAVPGSAVARGRRPAGRSASVAVMLDSCSHPARTAAGRLEWDARFNGKGRSTYPPGVRCP